MGTTTLTDYRQRQRRGHGRRPVQHAGPITVIGCGISANTAESGGGLYNDGGTTALTTARERQYRDHGRRSVQQRPDTVIGCSISGNTGTAGGGLYNSYTANLYASTIADNSAVVGGGIDNEADGGAALEDTIVATNIGTGGAPSDIGGVNAVGVVGTYDLVGTGGSGGIAGGTGDIVLTDLSGLALAPLGNYGGPTETMPLLPGSVGTIPVPRSPGSRPTSAAWPVSREPRHRLLPEPGIHPSRWSPAALRRARPPAPRSPFRWPSPSRRSIRSSR